MTDHPPHPGAEGPALPELRLDLAALESNIERMADWCRGHDVELCPHIKTTMTRPIVERQLAAGAWGVTVATVAQAAVAVGWGVRRMIIANQVVLPHELLRLRGWLEADPDLELSCLVDSSAGADRAAAAFSGAGRALDVLVDIGTPQGRTGVRTVAAASALAARCRDADGLRLAGVSGYEGVRPNRRTPDNLADVDRHCQTAVGAFGEMRPWFERPRPIFTMGGSAFPDLVLDALTGDEGSGDDATVVLRSGCYVTHDHGTYAAVSPVPGLRAALAVRAVVLSAPEPGLVVVGAGKRELPYDAGLPVLLGAIDASGARRTEVRGTASQIFDHHLVLTEVDGLAVGDVVDLGISHPCSAFDRWPSITVVDGGGSASERWHPEVR